ncbi:MAG TPA: UDP-N-acetylmuramate dehydrogenase [Bacteroidales bacterium]|nr:UDP-N-acetylmuramate dehydrogenase [Bacteroidales bacterium]
MIQERISLKGYNTFGLDYKADKLVVLDSEQDVCALAGSGVLHGSKTLIIGSGSNLLFLSDFNGTILSSGIGEIRTEDDNGTEIIVSVGAGILWDEFVGWCVDNELSGVENLSYIPGKVGAAPVQNIGAYGMEARDTIVRVNAVNLETGVAKEFDNKDCSFGYRESIFKKELKNRYLITRVFFRLSRQHHFRLEYGFLEAETAALGEISLQNIRKAVINIRRRKLPDPSVTGNAGSFFKNPVVTAGKAESIKHDHPLVPVYDDPSGGKKIPAGWLIEQCGWKGKRLGGAAVHNQQALVLINTGNATGTDIFNLSEQVRTSVFERFGILLDREVEIISPS